MICSYFVHLSYFVTSLVDGQDSGVASPLSGSVEGADGSLKTPKDTTFQNLSQDFAMVSKYHVHNLPKDFDSSFHDFIFIYSSQ